MTPVADPLDVVARLISAIEAGDLAGVRAMYSSDAVVWANFDDKARDVDSSMGVVGWLVGATTTRRYEIVRRIEIDGGVLQQHVLHCTTNSGTTFSMPACLVLGIDGEHVTRVDEYLDPAPVAEALG